MKPSQGKTTTPGAPAKRAEEVRARHNRQTGQPVRTQPLSTRSAPRNVHFNYTARPVVIRNSSTSLPLKRNVQSKVRKQVVIPLSTPGAEIRLPALALVRPGWRLVSGILAIFLAFILYTIYNNPMFQLGPVTVAGAQRLTADEINTALGVEGLPVIEAVPQQMETTLRRTFPDLAKVQVTVSLPAKLKVTVVERKPVLAWEQDGKVTWIDADGIAFAPRGDAGPLPLVKAEGAPPKPAAPEAATTPPAATPAAKTISPADGVEAPSAFMTPDLLKALIDLGAQAPKDTPVIYNPEYGMGWKDPAGWQVYFGSSTTDMASKLITYHGIVAYLNKNGITPKLISVEFANAPFYRMEP